MPNNEEIKKMQNKNDDKENVKSAIRKAFEKDSEEHYNVNNKCQKLVCVTLLNIVWDC